MINKKYNAIINGAVFCVGFITLFVGVFYQLYFSNNYCFPLLQLLLIDIGIICSSFLLYGLYYKINLLYWPIKHRVIMTQFLVLIILQSFEFYISCDVFFTKGGLFWDNYKLFSYFFDNLHSLNYFGEIAYWFPHIQYGLKGYFYSLLGDMNCISPIFMTIGAIFWLLGKFHIIITSIHDMYVWYYGAIIPFLFTISMWTFARRILSSGLSQYYVIIVSIFSPGTLLNISDIGFLEPIAFSFLLLSSYLRFIKDPSPASFWVLSLFILIWCLSANYTYTLFAILFVPLFLIVYNTNKSSLNDTINAIKIISLTNICILLFSVIVCIIPKYHILIQNEDMIKTSFHGLYYNANQLHSGDPLIYILNSVPVSERIFRIGHDIYYADYNYTGILTVPLMIYGMIFNKTLIKRVLLICIAVFALVFTRSTESYLFSLIIKVIHPLQTQSHYADLLFRGGGFALVILGAGIGLDQYYKKRSAFFMLLYAAIVISSIEYCKLYNMDISLLNSKYYAIIFITLLLLIIALHFNNQYHSSITIIILLLVIIDVYIVQSPYVNVLHNNAPIRVVNMNLTHAMSMI